MNDIKTYSCPNCGSSMTFDSKTQKLHCAHCDTTVEVEAMKAYKDSQGEAKNPDWERAASNAGSSWSSEEKSSTKTYVCPNCGAEVTTDDATAASMCAYCGTPVVLSDKLSGKLRPDYVIPFKFDKNSAIDKLKAHYKGKLLLPKAFKEESHLEEIKGVYVPFWLYNADIDGQCVFDAEKIRSYRQGDYDVTETSHYLVIREGMAAFERVPVDAASNMEDSYMDSIEPFNYGDLADFSLDYLPGFMAQSYDEDASKCAPRATSRMKNTMEELLRATCHYDTLSIRQSNLSASDSSVSYTLLPVWILNTRWKNKNYYFTMNGQNGNVAGKLPADTGKFLSLLFGITFVLGTLLKLFIF